MIDVGVVWPYEIDEARANAWMEELLDRQADGFWHRRRYRLIGNLKCAFAALPPLDDMQAGSSSLDIRIYGDLDDRGGVLGRVDSLMLARGERYSGPEGDFIPPFSSDPEVAALLWPEDMDMAARRPTTSAVDCCIAALCERWAFDENRITPRRGW
jgi:hypothetical protein